jgi:tartrate/fumarate subfamily iron-sulfur-dependent hydro-lyase beta chain
LAKAMDLPVDEGFIRSLSAGDIVLISGRVVTARDSAHRILLELLSGKGDAQPLQILLPILRGGAIYHCGPLAVREGSGWRILSAGPTTSARMEGYEAEVIRGFGIRAIIGKGGMGTRTKEALCGFGAVYLSAVGGAGVVMAERIKGVEDVLFLEELGIPEAIWILEVEDFPAIVTMDSHGRDIHNDVLEKSGEVLSREIGITLHGVIGG